MRFVYKCANTCSLLAAALFVQLSLAQSTSQFYSFAVTSGGADEIIWPAAASASAFQAQSCSDQTCATTTDLPGTPALLCSLCTEFVLSYTPPAGRRLQGIGSYYRVQFTQASGVSYSPATAAQDGSGPTTLTAPIFVDPISNRGSTAASCGAWASPCALIQDALAKCPTGGTVWLGPGYYAGTGNVENSFNGAAITVSSYAGAAATAVNGAGQNRGFIFNTGEIYTSVLNGITVIYGASGGGASADGAALLIDSAGPVISNCIFASGVAAGDGGAICITNSRNINIQNPAVAYQASTTITGTTFINNTAENGGGISVTGSVVLASNSAFEYNFAIQSGAGRGGALVANFAGILLTNVAMSYNYAVFSGGGVHTEAAISIATCTGVQMLSNSAASFGGAFTSFAGSSLTFSNSEFSDNASGFYGGGILALYGNATVTNSRINRNRSTYGGGATKALAGSLFVDGCEVANNTANAGAGTEIAGAEGYITVVLISNSIFSGNVAQLQGAGFNLGSTNATTFSNVTFVNNIATSGGAGYCAGDTNPISGSLTLHNSYLVGNSAQLGGAMYATSGCIAVIQGTTFQGNLALEYGGAIVTSDDVELSITGSVFTSNGNSATQVPPSAGGAISIGYNQFVAVTSVIAPPITNVTISSSQFIRNAAISQGGAVNLQAGNLDISGSSFTGNVATGQGSTNVGTGGALAVVDACTSSSCGAAAAIITNSNFNDNFADQAGGAVYYSTANTGSSLAFTTGTVSGNRVQYSLSDRNKYGLGGGIYVGNSSFSLTGLTLSNNSAFFGGAFFASANFSQGSVLSSLSFGVNQALLGTDEYWLRSASPSAALQCVGCSHASAAQTSVSTEVIQLAFVTPPPTAVQSSEAAASFVVGLQDFYGSRGVAEYSGTCQVVYNGTAVTLPDLGRVVDISNGTGTFQQLEVQGGIGTSLMLQVTCTPSTDAQNPLLPSALPIPAITLPLSVLPCPSGTEERGVVCQACDLAFFNYDGTNCIACPEGAQCPGGSLGLANPLLTQAGYWRSNATSADLFRCATASACLGYPTASGEAYADASCPPGRIGPLCAVCAPGSFGFGGSCTTCSGSPQGRLMLAFAVIAFVALLAVLFIMDFGTDIKPGMMTRIKILLTHFQLMSLLRDYDVTWPDSTHQALSWTDTLNVGVSISAPGCWIPHYNFFAFYIMQMAMPILLVLLCLGVYMGALQLTRKLEAYIEDGVMVKMLPEEQAEGWLHWLEDMQTRCYKNAFWFVTLLYPRCAQTSMQMFATQTLDIGTYLKADYSIATRYADGHLSHIYTVYLVFGTVLVILFTLVIPIAYFVVLWMLRDRLEEEQVIKKFGFLYGGYAFHYWEIADMVRKLAIAAIPVFIKTQPTGSLQAVLGEVVLVAYIFVTAYLKPFASPSDNLLQTGSMLVLWCLLLSGESLKWAKLSSHDQSYVSEVQVILTVGVALGVIIGVIYNLGFVRRGAQALYRRLTGQSNKVAPSGPESAASSSVGSATEAKGKAKASDSDVGSSFTSKDSFGDGSDDTQSVDGSSPAHSCRGSKDQDDSLNTTPGGHDRLGSETSGKDFAGVGLADNNEGSEESRERVDKAVKLGKKVA